MSLSLSRSWLELSSFSFSTSAPARERQTMKRKKVQHSRETVYNFSNKDRRSHGTFFLVGHQRKMFWLVIFIIVQAVSNQNHFLLVDVFLLWAHYQDLCNIGWAQRKLRKWKNKRNHQTNAIFFHNVINFVWWRFLSRFSVWLLVCYLLYLPWNQQPDTRFPSHYSFLGVCLGIHGHPPGATFILPWLTFPGSRRNGIVDERKKKKRKNNLGFHAWFVFIFPFHYLILIWIFILDFLLFIIFLLLFSF